MATTSARPPTGTFDFNGQRYNLSDPAQLAILMQEQARVIESLQENQPQEHTPWQQIITALQRPEQVDRKHVLNPGRSTEEHPVYFEYHQPLPGHRKDNKKVTLRPFNGERLDAHYFLERIDAYFLANQFASEYTYQRIPFVCDNLTGPAKSWGNNVKKAIVKNEVTSDYYYDDWEAFKTEFLRRFGMDSPERHFQKLLREYKQKKNQDCRAFKEGFEMMRQKAKIGKPEAYLTFKQNTHPDIRRYAKGRHPAPRTYDAWAEFLVEHQEDIDEEKDFQDPDHTPSFRYSAGKGHHAHKFQLAPGMQPMDLDAIVHSYIQAMQGKPQPKKGDKSKTRKTQPQPKASSSKATSMTTRPLTATRPSNKQLFDPSTGQKKRIFCFKCDGPDHYARNCTNEIKNSPHKIAQMAELLDQVLRVQEMEEAASEQDSDSEEEEQEEVATEEEEESLIDLRDQDF